MMRGLLIAIALLAACGGGSKATTAVEPGPGPEAPPAQSWWCFSSPELGVSSCEWGTLAECEAQRSTKDVESTACAAVGAAWCTTLELVDDPEYTSCQPDATACQDVVSDELAAGGVLVDDCIDITNADALEAADRLATREAGGWYCYHAPSVGFSACFASASECDEIYTRTSLEGTTPCEAAAPVWCVELSDHETGNSYFTCVDSDEECRYNEEMSPTEMGDAVLTSCAQVTS